jgi:hypothetical protein
MIADRGKGPQEEKELGIHSSGKFWTVFKLVWIEGLVYRVNFFVGIRSEACDKRFLLARIARMG